jgi:hypothetical protein
MHVKKGNESEKKDSGRGITPARPGAGRSATTGKKKTRHIHQGSVCNTSTGEGMILFYL